MDEIIKDALLEASRRYARRANGEEIVDSCPVCNAVGCDCEVCPIGNNCRNTPIMEYLSGGRKLEDAKKASEFLYKLALDGT